MEKKRGDVNVNVFLHVSEHLQAAFCVRVCVIYLIVYIGTVLYQALLPQIKS